TGPLGPRVGARPVRRGALPVGAAARRGFVPLRPVLGLVERVGGQSHRAGVVSGPETGETGRAVAVTVGPPQCDQGLVEPAGGGLATARHQFAHGADLIRLGGEITRYGAAEDAVRVFLSGRGAAQRRDRVPEVTHDQGAAPASVVPSAD